MMVIRQVIKCEACGAALHPDDGARYIVCEYCGTRTAIAPDITEVQKVQTAVQGEKAYCRSCGSAIPADAAVCCHCGKHTDVLSRQVDEEIRRREEQKRRQKEEEDNRRKERARYERERMYRELKAENEHRKWIAFTLCVLFGYFGVHKFYERKWLWGVAYLFTGGLFGFGWLIDCVRILFRSTEPR